MEIKALREKLGLTQQQLADELCTTCVTVKPLETRQCEPSPMANKLLRALEENWLRSNNMITLSAYDIKERRIVATVDGSVVEHIIAVVRAVRLLTLLCLRLLE